MPKVEDIVHVPVFVYQGELWLDEWGIWLECATGCDWKVQVEEGSTAVEAMALASRHLYDVAMTT